MHTAGCKATNRKSVIQSVLEALIPAFVAEELDVWMMNKTITHWNSKYSYLDDDERNFRLRSTRNVSKAHPDSVHRIILNTYTSKLKQFNLQ